MSEFIFYKCQIFYSTLLLKGLYKCSLEICEIFWDVKTENGFSGLIQKTLDTKRARIFETQL